MPIEEQELLAAGAAAAWHQMATHAARELWGRKVPKPEPEEDVLDAALAFASELTVRDQDTG